jgi:maleate cis-trans isomerase
MLEEIVPKRKIGVLSPLPVIGSGVYEFYCMAPPGVLLQLVPVGLREFTRENAEQVLAQVDKLVDMLTDRNVDLIMQSGVPPALLIGMEDHNKLMDRIAARAKLPVASAVGGVAAAARNVGMKKVVAANRWSEKMNAGLKEFFAREGVELVGVASQQMPAGTIQKRSLADGLDLAYQMGKRALEQYPEADGLYIGGSGWMVQPSAERLEKDFGKPIVTNKNAMVWDCCRRIDYWTPIPNRGRVLGAP